MTRLTRRDVLKATAAASTLFPLFTVAGTRASGQVVGANERLRVGVVGIGGRGSGHVGEFLQIPNVEVAYLIDPDSRRFPAMSKVVTDRSSAEPKCVQDIA